MRADVAAPTLDSATVQLIADITKEVDGRLTTTVRTAVLGAQDVDVSVSSELRDKVVRSIGKLQKGLLERETEVRPVPGLYVCMDSFIPVGHCL